MRLLPDENIRGDIIRGLLRQKPALDMLRVQDVPRLIGQDDITILAWAAEQGRVLFTHDVRTITHFAYERMRTEQPVPGVAEISQAASIGQVIEDILFLVEASQPQDLENVIIYLPFKKQ